jgi:hypothetical protein
MDRVLAGLFAELMRPARLLRSAVVLKPSTIMAFHRALVQRQYRLLFTRKRRGRRAPKGPSPELINAISSDHDPLLEFHRWKANLRILEAAISLATCITSRTTTIANDPCVVGRPHPRRGQRRSVRREARTMTEAGTRSSRRWRWVSVRTPTRRHRATLVPFQPEFSRLFSQPP